MAEFRPYEKGSTVFHSLKKSVWRIGCHIIIIPHIWKEVKTSIGLRTVSVAFQTREIPDINRGRGFILDV